MSSTNVTEFYGLTQYVGSDKPSFLDNNEAFRVVDAALHGAVVGVEDASDAVTALTGRVGDVEEAVTGLSGTVGTQGDAITALQNKEISQDGDIAEVKAAALDMVCAFKEEAAQSVHAYAIGDFFRYNDVLYKATSVINIGDTIIPNTNCTATNVAEQLLDDIDNIGDLSTLTTTDKTDAVAAINEVNAHIGTLSSLTTTDKTDAVAAINEVNAHIGTLSSLTTTDKTSAVAAINEVKSDLAKTSYNNYGSQAELTATTEGTAVTLSHDSYISCTNGGTAILLSASSNTPRVALSETVFARKGMRVYKSSNTGNVYITTLTS